jgi:aspartyl-tRNA(Asn)/glutamyl-tRNA(Gln) amidotransferase subunit A
MLPFAMSSSQLAFATIHELAPLLARKKISPVELTRAMLERIEQLNPRLNAYLTVTDDLAHAQACRAEQELLRGRCRGPLHGIPLALKDNIWTRGVRTTAGSMFLADFVPTEDATLVRRLFRAGAILLGKTNLHEFAYGVTTNNAHFGPTHNPWNLARIPGGSSGGSGAALAAGLCFASVGSDTGGSIRIPAALCGVVGLKPTFGRVSCHGVVPLARSFDVAGPLARSVADAALLLSAIAGADPLDPATVRHRVPDYAASLRARKVRFRLGWPRQYFWEKLDPEVRAIAEKAARSYETLGAVIEEVSLPHINNSIEPSTQIALAEARAFHEGQGWYPARAADYSEEVRKRLEMGADVRATDYLHALEKRKIVRADFEAAFARVDAILAPTTPFAPPEIGQKTVRIETEEEPIRGALVRMNRPANFTGLPAISVPCGFTRAGLPVGLQLIGRAFDEAGLLRIAHLYDQSHDWRDRHPAVCSDGLARNP